MNISVVYPAYNEEDGIENTTQKSLASLRRDFKNFEIVIVDDGSSDRTAFIARNRSYCD